MLVIFPVLIFLQDVCFCVLNILFPQSRFGFHKFTFYFSRKYFLFFLCGHFCCSDRLWFSSSYIAVYKLSVKTADIIIIRHLFDKLSQSPVFSFNVCHTFLSLHLFPHFLTFSAEPGREQKYSK